MELEEVARRLLQGRITEADIHKLLERLLIDAATRIDEYNLGRTGISHGILSALVKARCVRLHVHIVLLVHSRTRHGSTMPRLTRKTEVNGQRSRKLKLLDRVLAVIASLVPAR